MTVVGDPDGGAFGIGEVLIDAVLFRIRSKIAVQVESVFLLERVVKYGDSLEAIVLRIEKLAVLAIKSRHACASV